MENDIIEQKIVEGVEPQQEENKEEPIIAKEKKEAIKNFIKTNKKKVIIIAGIIVVLLAIYFSRGFFIAATVDGSPISRLSILGKLEKEAGKSLVDSVITEKLIQNEAKAKKIVISNEDIDSEIKKVEEQIKAQGATLEKALSAQGMSMDDLKKQIVLQKSVEKLVGDKVAVTDEEIAQYIKDNNVPVTKGQESTLNEQVRAEISNQKLSAEAQSLISSLRAKAKIKYFVKYQ